MTVPQNGTASTAHVNMMTDTIIANLSTDGLRVVIRSLLTTHPELTSSFESATRGYVVEKVAKTWKSGLKTALGLDGLKEIQRTVRCMLGCGIGFQSLPLLADLAVHGTFLKLTPDTYKMLVSINGDIVQAVTAIQKALFVQTGVRTLLDNERLLVQALHQALVDCQDSFHGSGREYPYGRGLLATSSLLGLPVTPVPSFAGILENSQFEMSPPAAALETFQLQKWTLPRIFSGLWQMSSPAWGAASTSQVTKQFHRHVQSGLTAFDMADHYGDAEIIFGQFRSSHPYKDSIFAATKYCVFHPMIVSREAVQANVAERCRRLQQSRIDLLQFHWQFDRDPQYLDVLRYLAEDERVAMIGLCNFDTNHLQQVLDSGIPVQTNQIQFSLIDSRPLAKMAPVCEKHNIKLLTYGTLCGGFLADKWLGKPEPDLYDESITPSQRKYYTMIRTWGSWSLFQELLATLQRIATRHNVTVSNVATRWVLDFPCVGAVIVGVRMGISEHTDETLSSFGWSLTHDDREAIEKVLIKSRRTEMLTSLGDCGREYRV